MKVTPLGSEGMEGGKCDAWDMQEGATCLNRGGGELSRGGGEGKSRGEGSQEQLATPGGAGTPQISSSGQTVYS